jgi:hypothetical protein
MTGVSLFADNTGCGGGGGTTAVVANNVLSDPNLPLPNARFRATNCTGLLSGNFGHMLRPQDTRRLASGDRTPMDGQQQ